MQPPAFFALSLLSATHMALLRENKVRGVVPEHSVASCAKVVGVDAVCAIVVGVDVKNKGKEGAKTMSRIRAKVEGG